MMTERGAGLMIALVELHREYLCVGGRTREYLALIRVDASAFVAAHRAALEATGVDALIAAACQDVAGEDETEAALLRLMACHRTGLDAVCALMDEHGFDTGTPERLWHQGLRGAGVIEALAT